MPLLLHLNTADITCGLLFTYYYIRTYRLLNTEPIRKIGTIIDAGLWINIECNIGIVCACLPIMRPLFRAVSPFASILSHVGKYSRNRSQQGGSSDRRTSSFERMVSKKGEGSFDKGGRIELNSVVSLQILIIYRCTSVSRAHKGTRVAIQLLCLMVLY